MLKAILMKKFKILIFISILSDVFILVYKQFNKKGLRIL